MMRRLTATTGVDPSDVLVLAGSVLAPMTEDGVTFQCANVTVRTMGDTRKWWEWKMWDWEGGRRRGYATHC